MSGKGHNLSERVSDAYERYYDLLRRTEEITDQLLAAIDGWDVEEVPRLIDERSRLSDSTNEAFRKLDALVRDALGHYGKAEPVAKEIETCIESVRSRQRSLLGKQRKSERLLSAGLASHKPARLSVRHRRDLQGAYVESDSTHDARFLDTVS